MLAASSGSQAVWPKRPRRRRAPLAALLLSVAAGIVRSSRLCYLLPVRVSPARLEHQALARRGALVALLPLPGLVAAAEPASAFSNRVAQVKGPKQPGFQPQGVGTGELNGCGVAPNCFSSAPGTDEDHYLKPWQFSDGGVQGAIADLEKVISAYPPGQKEIDGGGFEIQQVDASKGYMYVQFESLKKGFIDDVEFIARAGSDGSSGEVLVRSASRLGYLDMGVNAKRLNKLSEDLRALGSRWTAPKVTAEAYPRYVSENR
eukprot:gb/GFBE01058895.1/.p1 GENE.gb/GFBE01058895.1/~~gb/GFBE01058895.1/.p1  ORF type:complete len:261 (+),score=54.94 gb/GFBE01058895.1/:1-783(+)